MNVQKAADFIRSNGSSVEQARLHYLLTGERPSQELAEEFFAGQRMDGGWAPFWSADYTSLDATCFRLAQAEQLGLALSEPAIVRAVHFLAQRQSPDGSWEEDKKVAGLAPPWAAPGELTARLYLTANCGLWLALAGGEDKGAAKAATYLQMHLGQDRRLPGFLHTQWLAAGLWQKLEVQTPAEHLLGYLEAKINDLTASNLAWLVTTLCAAGMRSSHQLLLKAAGRLEQSQEGDGRWASEDGSGQDVHTTLEALRALWLCGRLTLE